nr:MAG TPA: hypothetical protein [Inoviridae sp.]
MHSGDNAPFSTPASSPARGTCWGALSLECKQFIHRIYIGG